LVASFLIARFTMSGALHLNKDSIISNSNFNQSFIPPEADASSLNATFQSLTCFACPDQALMFIDWDDTLFPTTHMRMKYRYPWDGSCESIQRLMKPAGAALRKFLETACMLSTRCVILTLAQPGWIEQECLPMLEPEVTNLMQSLMKGDNLRIVYADQGTVSWGRGLACLDSFRRCTGRDGDAVDKATIQKLMAGKQQAMTREAAEFYSRYPEQSWKNILSIGDSMYEYTAMQRLGSVRRKVGGKERHLRSKAVRVQQDPSVTSLILQLRLFEELLPALVQFNGCLNLNLPESRDPLKRIAKDLNLPQIIDLHPLRCIWDHEWDAAGEERFLHSLMQVRKVVENLVGAPSTPSIGSSRSGPLSGDCEQKPPTDENNDLQATAN